MESKETSRKGLFFSPEDDKQARGSPWARANALAYSVLLLGMSAVVIVDGLYNIATGEPLLFEGVSPIFKIWAAMILLLLSAGSLGKTKKRWFLI